MDTIIQIDPETRKATKICRVYPDGSPIQIHPVVWALKLSPTAKRHLFEMGRVIDPETMLVCFKRPDGTKTPLSKTQLKLFLNTSEIGLSLDKFVLYGIFANFELGGRNFYIANPYIINRGRAVNAFLLEIFNPITIASNAKMEFVLKADDRENFNKIYKKMEETDAVEAKRNDFYFAD